MKEVFAALALDCKTESATRNMGAPEEVAAMMDSFAAFAHDSFFANSEFYPFTDGTNRHGIAHGAYADEDYGSQPEGKAACASLHAHLFQRDARPALPDRWG